MAGRLTTHELAEFLSNLTEALREGPDLPVADLLKQMGLRPPAAKRRERTPAEPPPPVDPAALSRDELGGILQDKKRFRTKRALVDFARAHSVAVSEKARIAEIVGQVLRVLYDIPQERSSLREFDPEEPTGA
jgi:hypothetical protein